MVNLFAKAKHQNMRRWVLLSGLAVVGLWGCHPVIKPDTEVTPEEYASYADVPLYPNAYPVQENPTIPPPEVGGFINYRIELHTNDPVESVRRYYVEQLKMEAFGNHEAWNLNGKSKKGNDLSVSIVRAEEGTDITITSTTTTPPRR